MSNYLTPSALGLALDVNGTSHYKFIVIFWCTYEQFYRSPSHGLTVSTFSSQNGQWETKQGKFGDDTYDYLELSPPIWGASSLHFNGNLYWLFSMPPCMIVFCLETETFRAFDMPQPDDYDDQMGKGVLWESEGRLYFCQICDLLGLCIWVLDAHHHHRLLEAAISDDKLHELPWRKTFRIPYDTMNSMLTSDLIRKEASLATPFFYGVSSFNEHLQIVHLDSTEGLVRLDIGEKKMSLVSDSRVREVAMTYRGFILPDYPTPLLPSRSSERKRNLDDLWEPVDILNEV